MPELEIYLTPIEIEKILQGERLSLGPIADYTETGIQLQKAKKKPPDKPSVDYRKIREFIRNNP